MPRDIDVVRLGRSFFSTQRREMFCRHKDQTLQSKPTRTQAQSSAGHEKIEDFEVSVTNSSPLRLQETFLPTFASQERLNVQSRECGSFPREAWNRIFTHF